MLSIASAARRRLLGAAGAAISGLAGGLAIPRLVFAQNNKSVKFTLPWVPEGSDLFAFTAKGMGFWDKHGLDVSIARGVGSVAAAEATGTGRFDFGMAAAPVAILQNVKGLPVTALGCCQYDEGRAPAARNKAGEIRKARGRRREQERNRATPRRWRPLCLRDAGGSLSLAGWETRRIAAKATARRKTRWLLSDLAVREEFQGAWASGIFSRSVGNEFHGLLRMRHSAIYRCPLALLVYAT